MTGLLITLAIAMIVGLTCAAVHAAVQLARLAQPEPEAALHTWRLDLGDDYVNTEFTAITEQWIDGYLTSDSPIEQED